MAGDWIKFETSTLDKPEVWSIATELGIDPDAVVGKLLRVWAWFDNHSEDGNAPSVTSALLDRNCGVTGFVSAMVNCGWMVEEDGKLSIPNFDRHNGQTAKKRALTAKRVANHKKTNAEGNAPGNAKVTLDALPREEKRREEKNKEEEGGEVALMEFPTREGGTWKLTRSIANELKKRFPTKDRKTEYERARDWLEADDGNLKTAQGMKRFLANWLTKAEDKPQRERVPTGYELQEQSRREREERERLRAAKRAMEGAA